MPKKNWTPEERQAFADKMRSARAKANDQARELVQRADRVAPSTDPEEQILSNNDIRDLVRRVKELESYTHQSQTNQFGPQVNNRGGLIGTYEKYAVDPAHYPDPTARLARESRLQRFAFPINYELAFTVTTTNYQTQDGVNTKEPKFTLELLRVVLDDDTGDPTNGRYVIRRAIFHEDPQAAIAIAREQGLGVDDDNERSFLDEMRYLRMRDWLLEAFYPPRPTGVKSNKREMVIGNKIVDYFEINSTESQSMPFGELKGKL